MDWDAIENKAQPRGVRVRVRSTKTMPWDRVVYSLTGTAVLIALMVQRDWGGVLTLFLWLLLMGLVWKPGEED